MKKAIICVMVAFFAFAMFSLLLCSVFTEPHSSLRVVAWFGVTYRLWGWGYSRLAGFALGSSGVSQTAIVNAMRSGIGFSLKAQRHSASVKPEAK